MRNDLNQMFSSRNIHFIVLGLILGATSGYIFAFYQIDQKLPSGPRVLNTGGGNQGHPDVSNDQILAMFKEQLKKDPSNADVWARYGDFLSDVERYAEAVDAYKEALKLKPGNIDAQTFMGTALWNMGKKDEAVAAYQKSLKSNPNHMPTLYYLAFVDLDRDHNVTAAAQKLAQMEKIDSTQPALTELRQRIEEERKKGR